VRETVARFTNQNKRTHWPGKIKGDGGMRNAELLDIALLNSEFRILLALPFGPGFC
jgi:hypothetical protein